MAQSDMTVVELREWLRNWVCRATGLDISKVTDDRSLEEYGLSSRDAVSLSADLEDLLGRPLDATVAYQHPTIETLAEYVINGPGELDEPTDMHTFRERGAGMEFDVAVIGMEDDPTLCEFCQPTLSSVSRDPWAMGTVSAEMVDRLMNGLDVPSDVAVPPDGVVARQSTDTIAVEDPHLAEALHFIHDHIQECFGIDEVIKATAISRRQLETRFRDTLGCSPHEYLCRKRVERVKHLLSVPERIKFHKLSRDCGFPNVERMRVVFKRVTGMTPIEFRQRQMAQASASGGTAIPQDEGLRGSGMNGVLPGGQAE